MFHMLKQHLEGQTTSNMLSTFRPFVFNIWTGRGRNRSNPRRNRHTHTLYTCIIRCIIQHVCIPVPLYTFSALYTCILMTPPIYTCIMPSSGCSAPTFKRSLVQALKAQVPEVRHALLLRAARP